MGDFFGSLYCWLEDFFGLDLADYLWGEISPEQTTNMFIGIGFTMLGISLFVMLLYYYFIDHPRLCSLWGWSIFLFVNAGVNFVVGWQWVLKDYYDGLMVTKDPVTQELVDLPIYPSDILAFGFTNMIDSIIAFVLFSIMFKWWSKNCPTQPF